MHKVTYRITTLSPLLFAMNVGDTNMVATREYIPGSVMMGLFACNYIQKKSLGSDAHRDDDFYKWFLKGDLRFSNAHIVSKDGDGKCEANLPLPLSIQKEKDDEAEIHDLLFNDEEKQMSAINGFGRIKGKTLYTQSVNKSLNFHHERDPQTGTTKEIFNYESIDSGQIFEGDISGRREDLENLLKIVGCKIDAHIGRSKNAQYGRVRLEFITNEPEEFISGTDGLSLTMLSNAIIYNSCGLSTTDIKVLEDAIGNGIKIKKSFIKTGEVENFVSVWRLRKPSEVCFMAGSCFLLEGISQENKPILLELQKEGIGERRGEGFGRIAFGWQKEGDLKKGKEGKKNEKKPSSAISSKTNEIVQTLVKDFIRKKMELKALQESDEFERLPSKSLIGRLEAMVKTQNKTTFYECLGKLRKTASDKLKGCRKKDKSQTLFNFLEDKEVSIEEIFRQVDMKEVKKLCDEISFKPHDDKIYEAELYRTYFITFFSAMRKKLKKGEG